MKSKPSVDVVIACYNETRSALAQTIRSCLRQSYMPRHIWIVDDGSTYPVSLPSDLSIRRNVSVLRREDNEGISASRNFGAAQSRSSFIWFINCEILPEEDWLETAVSFLDQHAKVGAVCGQVLPANPDSLLSRWRYHFQESPETRQDLTHPVSFAPGHAVLMRRTAFDTVGCYDERLRRTQEDSDISQRLWNSGYPIYQVEGLHCTSHQRDTISLCASKSLRNNGWTTDTTLKNDKVLRPVHVFRALNTETTGLLRRFFRNFLSLRWSLLYVDFLVYIYSLYLIFESNNLSNFFNR